MMNNSGKQSEPSDRAFFKDENLVDERLQIGGTDLLQNQGSLALSEQRRDSEEHSSQGVVSNGQGSGTFIHQFEDCDGKSIQEGETTLMAGKLQDTHFPKESSSSPYQAPERGEQSSRPSLENQNSNQPNFQEQTCAQKVSTQVNGFAKAAATAGLSNNLSNHKAESQSFKVRDDQDNKQKIEYQVSSNANQLILDANKNEQDDSSNKDQNFNSQTVTNSAASPNGELKREKRKVRDKTISYSLTHKGIQPSNQGPHQNVSDFVEGTGSGNSQSSKRRGMLGNLSKSCSNQHGVPGNLHSGEFNMIIESQQHGSAPEATIKIGEPLTVKASKKSGGPKTSKQCLESISNMFAFDWSHKDISNLKNNPYNEIANSPLIYWFYVCSQYFPFHSLQIAKQPAETFIDKIHEKLRVVGSQPNDTAIDQRGSFDHSIKEQFEVHQQINQPIEQSSDTQNLEYADQNQFQDKQLLEEVKVEQKLNTKRVDSVSSNQPPKDTVPDFIKVLFREKQMRRFKKLLQDMQTGQSFSSLITSLQTDLQSLTPGNRSALFDQFTRFQKSFFDALSQPLSSHQPDPIPYSGQNMFDFGLDFLSYVDPVFIQDINENQDWYLNHYRENSSSHVTNQYNEILLNVGYPSRQEKEFLKHVEQAQQKKNDDKYRKILKDIDNSSQEEKKKKVVGSANAADTRALAAQEDAQCVVCNNGDYEDEDMIVFCGLCNVPVHQSCYGIEQLPDEDWICYNCLIFGLKRGLMISCVLCPKKGGAMKPTNICTMNHLAMRKGQGINGFASANYSNNSLGKKHSAVGNSSSKKNNSMALAQPSENQLQYGDGVVSDQFALVLPSFDRKGIIDLSQMNEDKNLSLISILRREQDYWAEIWHIMEENKLKKNISEQSTSNNLLLKVMQKLNEIEFNFLSSERETQIPDDYSFFLQRNEATLEHAAADSDYCFVPTQYEWVHLSCATWIPGPTITPKTPIRLNKLDEKRFSLQCIICFKKEGACMQCQASRCTIAFHIECARRANYCMEIEKRSQEGAANSTSTLLLSSKNEGTRANQDKVYRVFCEKHRPLKIVKEMEERDLQTIEEIQRFCKIIEKCMDIDFRHQLKASSLRLEKRKEKEKREREREKERERQRIEERNARQGQIQANRDRRREEMQMSRGDHKRFKKEKPPKIPKVRPLSKSALREMAKREREKVKRWREKDKKQLFERVKERYLQFRKMRVNIIRMDPLRKLRKQQELLQNPVLQRKRSKKRGDKQQPIINVNTINTSAGSARRESLRQPNLKNDSSFKIVIPNFNPSLPSKRQYPESQLEEGEEISQIDLEEEKQIDLQHEESKEQTSILPQNEPEELEISQSMRLIGPEEGIFYKFATPVYPSDQLDWTVTLSRNDFPWHEIAFAPFSPRECYDKYTSVVRDPHTFLKKVLGLKEKYKKLMESQMQIQAVGLSTAGVENPAVYCRCKGSIVSELFVKCDGDQECPNGSWLHPQCTSDLRDKSKEELDAIEEWYCEDCVARINREELGIEDAIMEEEQIDIEIPEEMEDDMEINNEDQNEDIQIEIEEDNNNIKEEDYDQIQEEAEQDRVEREHNDEDESSQISSSSSSSSSFSSLSEEQMQY